MHDYDATSPEIRETRNDHDKSIHIKFFMQFNTSADTGPLVVLVLTVLALMS